MPGKITKNDIGDSRYQASLRQEAGYWERASGSLEVTGRDLKRTASASSATPPQAPADPTVRIPETSDWSTSGMPRPPSG